MSFPRQVVPGRVYLITRRCTQRQFLLRPDHETNNAFIYCFAYAASRAEIDVVAFIANSNHYHAVVIDRCGRIPQFLEEFHRLMAKHQNTLRDRRENFWSNQQTSLVELVGAEDVLAKTVYTLTNPAKDHLVERTVHWPGATSLRATIYGTPIRARRPLRFFRANGPLPARVQLHCVRAPGCEQLSDAEYAELLRSAISVVEADAAAERRETGCRVLGRKAILAQRPTDCPDSDEPRRKLNPTVAARDKLPRIEALAHQKEFRCAYASARVGWLEGQLVTFPVGTWWLRKFAAAPCEVLAAA
jgi:putative transposase